MKRSPNLLHSGLVDGSTCVKHHTAERHFLWGPGHKVGRPLTERSVVQSPALVALEDKVLVRQLLPSGYK